MGKKVKQLLKSAPPSLAVVAVLVAAGSICVSNLPTDYHEIANLKDITTSELFSKETLAMLRATAACVIFLAQFIKFSGPGWDEQVTYPEGNC